MIQSGDGTTVLIDTATEFRLQAVREGITRVDAVFFTHAHADHVHGLDDLRPLGRYGPIPLYGSGPTVDEIRQRFSYIFSYSQEGGGKPNVNLSAIEAGKAVEAGSFRIIPVPVHHGSLEVFGYRAGNFAYLTDCSAIPETSFPLLEGVRFLVIDALRPRPHPTHFSFDEAIREIRRIGPEKAWFTHLSHDSDHSELSAMLPEGIEAAWDSLSFDIRLL
jgi:phosphoribosyl 1,2-cyclic phosphate phosphodiesterase